MAPSSQNLCHKSSFLSEKKQKKLQELKKRVRHRTAGEGKHMYFGKYVSHEGSANLLTYEYHGVDNSLIYKYILTPMNNFLVTLLPLWLAPNLITLIGLLLVSFSHVLFIYYCPFLEGDIPPWLHIFSAITLFMYQTLDNLDGKQARRTGTSSPLGLLFDHGCDAINVTVGSITMACVLQVGATWKALALTMTAQIAFICATWEEYYSGSLELPIINGPTEGILIAIGLKLFTAYKGPSVWLEEYFPGIYNHTLVVLLMLLGAIPTLAANAVNVVNAVRLRHDSIPIAFTRLLPSVSLNLIAVIWMWYSPSNIFSRNPRLFLWMLGFLNSKLVLHLMLAHLCGEEYHPFRKTLVPLFYVAAHCGFSMLEEIYDAINEALILKEMFFLSLVSYVHIVITVIWEVKNVLGIQVFTVSTTKNSHSFLKKKQK